MNNTQPGFRPYAPSDEAACCAILEANTPEFFAPNEYADFCAFLKDQPVNYQVCELEDQIVGAFGLAPSGNTASLNWIMLSPEAQGKGVGRAMMEWAIDYCRRERLTRMAIAASHRSAPFFARFGAIEIRRTEHGWGPDMHRIDMELPVEP